MMRRVYRHKWSLVSGVSTAVNCLVIYIAKLYEPSSTGPSPWSPPTPAIFLVLYWVEVFLGLFGVTAAIGGMFRRESPTYTRMALVLALFACAISVAPTMSA
jgi:hypothetical protein